ncbi:MAG: helix-turn-helix transcriptional regulator [Spirochaetales bacterium]|nr:helix-turn-helix transcriptional regulator [Spirochaetales bacterium]
MDQTRMKRPNVFNVTPLLNRTTPGSPVYFTMGTLTDKYYSMSDMHLELELGIVLSGRIQRNYENHQLPVNPGEVWLHSIWEPHSYLLLESPCEILVFLINPDLFNNIKIGKLSTIQAWLAPFNLIPETRPQIRQHQTAKVFQIAQELKAADKSKDEYRSEFIQNNLIQLMLLIISNIDPDHSANTNEHWSAYQSIQPAVLLVFDNPQLTQVKEAAAACSMSVSSFQEKFKKFMQITYAEFALRYRLGRAISEIIREPQLLKGIGEKWGFNDQSHFYHTFKKTYGCTPGEYIKKYKI